MIVVIVVILCVVLVAVGAYLFLNQPQEGDECEGKDENGNYVIDDKGKCVLDDCASGYYKSGKECLVDQSGEDCVPEGTKDPQGIYLTDQMGGCEFSSCETGYIKEGGACVKDGKKEVFHIRGYTHTKDQAAGACATHHDAVVATKAQVVAALDADADWCSTGWVSDENAAYYPITTSIMAGCGGATPGLKKYTPTNGLAGVNCYGVKPDQGTEGIMKFNATKWSRYA